MVAWSLLQVDNNYLQLSETAGLTWWQTCGSRGQDKQTSSNMLPFFIFWCRIQILTPNNACFPCPSRQQVYRHTLWLGHVCNPRYAVHKELFTKDSRTCCIWWAGLEVFCRSIKIAGGAHHPSIHTVLYQVADATAIWRHRVWYLWFRYIDMLYSV